MTRWRYVAATDTGLVRATNQDALFVDDVVAVVADGMGGHAAGEVASAMAISYVQDEFHSRQTIEGLYRAIEAANRAILSDARQNPERFGMGTTVIAVGLTRDNAGVVSPTLFNVGDSRAYQLRDGALRQLSEDHSVAEEWVRMGRLTPEEALTHPRRHQLTRALGVEDQVEIDTVSVIAQPGDRILLCSDGLSNELSNEEIVQLASSPTTLEDSVRQLVSAANRAGGHDNISVILLEFDEVNVASVPVKRTVSTTAPPVAQAVASTSRRQGRRRAMPTWRTWAGVGVLALVVVGFFVIMHWYAYSTYYLGNDAGTVAVYQGQPSGVLWFKPVKVLDTPYAVSQLQTGDQEALTKTISEPSVAAALQYAYAMHSLWQENRAAATATTTTTFHTTTTVKKG